MGMYARELEYNYTDTFIRRVKPSAKQIEILNNFMLKCLYPDYNLIDNAHLETGLSQKFIKTWFQNRRAAFKKKNRRFLARRNSMTMFGKKHELCKLYRTQNSSFEEEVETDEPVFVIIDCTQEVISSYSKNYN